MAIKQVYKPGFGHDRGYCKSWVMLYFILYILTGAHGHARAQTEMMVDERDGKRYLTKQFGNQVWMIENLAYSPTLITRKEATETALSIFSRETNSRKEVYALYADWESTHKDFVFAYDDIPSNINQYGGLYPWDAALKSCPNGWHLPSRDEFKQLVQYLKSNDISDSVFQARPAGGLVRFGARSAAYFSKDIMGYYWTSTMTERWGDRFITRVVIGDKLKKYWVDKTNISGLALSVRCVRN